MASSSSRRSIDVSHFAHPLASQFALEGEEEDGQQQSYERASEDTATMADDTRETKEEETRALNQHRPEMYVATQEEDWPSATRSFDEVRPASQRLQGTRTDSFRTLPGGRRPQHPKFLSQIGRPSSLSGLPSVGTTTSLDETHSWRARAVGNTPLERTIDAIGMGRYQYAVLVLSGCGWAADNMWLQGVAIVLPRVQDEFGISDQWVGLLSSSTFAGMMLGAVAWGSYSDMFGRKNAFNATLLITAVFGLFSSFAPSFPTLCLCLFLLGTGVGGSMPTDGTIFLESLPQRKHYLLTALSVFFAAGSVISSFLGLVIVPSRSCSSTSGGLCDPKDNKGWRWLLASLGLLTVAFVVLRVVFFRLFESPKYLVSAGKLEEARHVLQRIADFNGQPLGVRLSDVRDDTNEDGSGGDAMQTQMPSLFKRVTSSSRSVRNLFRSTSAATYSSLPQQPAQHQQEEVADDENLGARGSPQQQPWAERAEEEWPDSLSFVPKSWRKGLWDAGQRYSDLFTPEWRQTTILVWSIWTIFTLAYTMVNVFLPKYLEKRVGRGGGAGQPDKPASDESRQEAIQSVMEDFLLYSLASIPGSLMGAYLIETALGRIKSMALSSTFLALSLLAFALAPPSSTPTWTIVSSCAISLSAATSYAVIYSYSPEVFPTALRGTASGTASALSRLAGIVAPLLAGALMQIVDENAPLYLGFALFGFSVCLMLSLPIETKGRANEAVVADGEDDG